MSRHPGKLSARVAHLSATLACLAPLAAAAPQSTVDFSIVDVTTIQTIPRISLIGGKSTIVRAQIAMSGTLPAGAMVDGLMRVYVGGVEEPYSPIFSENGPFVPPAIYKIQQFNHALAFYFVPPTANNVSMVVEINPVGPGQLAETDYTNNTKSTGDLDFICTGVPEVAYSPIDYRPGGGGVPNLPNELLILPGAGDNFIQAIYPSADWDYHRTDAPSKLWTGSLTNGGSALLNSLLSDWNMMSPRPDFIYGWVPGALPGYNGQASGIPGRAGMGNTQTIRHQRTFAHELGHLFGRVHINNTVGRTGVDVEHHLNITESLPRMKFGSLFDIMVAGLLTNQAWIYEPNHDFYVNHAFFACTEERGVPASGKSLMLGGLWDRVNGTATWTDSVVFEGGIPSDMVPLAEANLLLRVYTENGGIEDFGHYINTTTDSCAGDTDSTEGELQLAGFMTVLPSRVDPERVIRVEIVDPATGAVMNELVRSNSAPLLRLTSPTVNSIIESEVLLGWTATDADGEALKYYVRYSHDGERLVPLASNLTQTGYQVDLSSLPELETDKGFFEIFATDGLRTTSVRTVSLTSATQLRGARTNRPWTNVLTPDPGKSFRKAATVILHASGWDLEDRALEGASLVWTSDLDGMIGTGRVTSTSNLSVGAHVLTVTATDSDGLTRSHSTSITITDRVVPDGFCQPNLGFGGPGTSAFQVCGGDLSTGTSAAITLRGAAPNAFLWTIYGVTNTPISVLGGTIIPLPIVGVTTGTTDADGNWDFPGGLTGGGGPVTYFAQVVYLDASFPAGFGISNAVQIDVLP